MRIHPSATIHPGASVHPTAKIGAGTTVGDGVTIQEEVVIGAGCHLEPDGDLLKVERGAQIGNNSQILGCRIGWGAQLGAETRLAPNTAIGEYSRAGDRLVLERGALMGRHVEAGDDCRIEERGNVSHCVTLGNGVRVGPGSRVEANARLNDNASIGAETGIAPECTVGKRSRIGEQTRIGMNAGIGIAPPADLGDDCVVGHGVMIDADATLADGSSVDTHAVLFAGSRVESGASMGAGAMLEPNAVLAAGQTLPPWTGLDSDGAQSPRDVEPEDLWYRNGPWPPATAGPDTRTPDDKPVRQGGDPDIKPPPPRPGTAAAHAVASAPSRNAPGGEARAGR